MDVASLPGTVTIAARAYQRIAQAVLAEELRVPPREVRARVRDERGALGLELESGILDDDASVAIRATDARARTAERTAELTGARVANARLRITHLVSTPHRRLS